MDELELLRLAAPDPGEPVPDTAARHRRELRDVMVEVGTAEVEAAGRKWSPRVLVPATITLVLLLIVGTIAAVRSREDADEAGEETGVVTSGDLFGGPSFPPGSSHPPLLLVPSAVPEGFALLQASGTGHEPDAGTIRSGSPGIDRVQHWVRLDAARDRPVEMFDISWGAGPSDGMVVRSGGSNAALREGFPPPPGQVPDDPLASYRKRSTPIMVRGHEGLYSEKRGELVWEEPEGQVVRIWATKAFESVQRPGTEALPRALLLQVADALTPRQDGGFTLREPPDGFELAAESAGIADGGSNPRTLVYKDPYDRGFALQLVDDSGESPGASLRFANTRLIDVRGRTAVIGPHLSSANISMNAGALFLTASDLSLQWFEADGTRVTLKGVGLTETELLGIAESLQPVDDETWLGLQIPLPTGPKPLKPTGPPPADEAAARAAVSNVFVAANTSDTPLAQRIALVDDPTGLRDAYRDAAHWQPLALANYHVEIREVRFLSPTEAFVSYDLFAAAPIERFPGRSGRVVLVDGDWKVSRQTVCGILGLAEASCRP